LTTIRESLSLSRSGVRQSRDHAVHRILRNRTSDLQPAAGFRAETQKDRCGAQTTVLCSLLPGAKTKGAARRRRTTPCH